MKTKRVGNWILEWDPKRPHGVWAVPEYLKTIKLTDRGVMYDDGRMGWDRPESTPASVRNAAPQFIRKCQGKRVTR